MVEIYTDGSTRNNGKIDSNGGAGLVVLIKNQDKKIDYYWSIKEQNTTNNRMELTALIKALELTQTIYKNKECVIKSDSAYCVNMFNEWIYNWNRNGWVRAKNQPIENLDLVKQIWEYCKIEWPNFIVEKVPGHSNVLGNELADLLATNQKDKFVKILEKNNIKYDDECIFDLD